MRWEWYQIRTAWRVLSKTSPENINKCSLNFNWDEYPTEAELSTRAIGILFDTLEDICDELVSLQSQINQLKENK